MPAKKKPPIDRIDAPKIDAALAFVKNSSAPLTLAEVIKGALGIRTDAEWNRQFAQELCKLPPDAGIYSWPDFKRNPIFCGRPRSAAVSEALLEALEQYPLTPANAAKPVAKILKRASQDSVLSDIKAAARGLASDGRIFAFAVSKTSVVYFSFAWLAGQIPANPSETALPGAILDGIRQLQSGPGNYVRIDHLKNSAGIRRVFDEAVIQLARADDLVLARYDGPRPLPEEQKPHYVEDRNGDLFIGVALPRPEAAH